MFLDQKRKRFLLIAALLLALVLTVVGFFVLPDTLVMQLRFDGKPGNTMPKPLGLAVPLMISAIFAVVFYRDREGNGKALLGLAVGLLLYLPLFLFNLL